MKNDVSLMVSIQKLLEIINNNEFSSNAITCSEHTLFKNHEVKSWYSDNEKNNKIIFFIIINVNNRNFYFCKNEIASDKTF